MASPPVDPTQQLVLDFASAVLMPEQWVPTLDKMARLFGGSFATFELIDRATGRHLQYFDSSDIEVQQDYLTHFLPLNPRIAFGNRPGAPDLLHDQLLISEGAMEKDPFYMDFLRPFDLRYFSAFRALETSDMVGVFTVQRSIRAGPPDPETLKRFGRFGRSLRNVASAQARYGHLLSRLDTLEAVFEKMPVGIITLDLRGRVLEVNSTAKAIFESSDGLGIVGGRLRATETGAQRRLLELIASLGHARDEVPFSQLFIPRSSGLPPYRLVVEPGHVTSMRSDGANTVVVVLEDPSRDIALEIEHLKDGFDLTAAEARVALLMTKGQSASEMARSSGVSIATIRTQIQRVLNKSGARRQIDLVRILSRYI
ncbi:MAG: PAS domain-containing protein [Pseudomonadota bacterium]